MKIKSRTLFEWSLVLLIILVIMGVFSSKMRLMQGQIELATFKSTLGSLRTAFVLEHLLIAVSSDEKGAPPLQRNPFLLLGQRPPNYAGSLDQVKLESVAPGHWVFDPLSNSVGYVLLNAQFLEKPANTTAVWFRVSGLPRPQQMTAIENYTWLGEVLQ